MDEKISGNGVELGVFEICCRKKKKCIPLWTVPGGEASECFFTGNELFIRACMNIRLSEVAQKRSVTLQFLTTFIANY